MDYYIYVDGINQRTFETNAALKHRIYGFILTTDKRDPPGGQVTQIVTVKAVFYL